MAGTDIQTIQVKSLLLITHYRMHNVMETCFVSPQFREKSIARYKLRTET